MATGAVFVGVVAPLIVILIVLAVIGGWHGARGALDADRAQRVVRERYSAEAQVLKREAFLRRRRDLRLGRLKSDPRDDPRDPIEGVRVLNPPDGAYEPPSGIEEL